MRVLICAQEPPEPAVNGFRVHLSPLVRELRRRHEVEILALRTQDAVESPGLRLVAPGPRPSRVASVVRRRPMDADAAAGALRGPLASALSEFRPDVVHVTPGRLAALARDLGGRPSVLGALDAWHLNVRARARLRRGAARLAARPYEWIVRAFERREYPAFDTIVVVSDEDRDAQRALLPGTRVVVIPNGVDVERFAHDGSSRHRSRIAFTGVMGYAPNVSAAERLARRVLPAVRRRVDDAHVVLAGRDPAPRVTALGALDGVSVTGEVADLAPVLSSASVFCCPMDSGTGIKNKLLEAMANGLPCVATPLAVQGLHAQDGRHLLVGGSDGDIAAHVARLLEDDVLAARIGRAARDYVTSEHSWQSAAGRWERTYEDAIARSSGRPPA